MITAFLQNAQKSFARRGTWASLLLSLFIIVPTVLITIYDSEFILTYGEEDGIIEYLSAFFFFGSGMGFIVLWRNMSPMRQWWGALVIVAWALLMFFFAAEELSWGQRIFDVDTPRDLVASNVQDEINLHNHEIVHQYSYRILSLFTIGTGVGIGLLSLIPVIGGLFEKFHVPVPPWGYAILFVGAHVYGVTFIPSLSYFADEFREFFMSCGMLFFAWHHVFFGNDSVLAASDEVAPLKVK